MRNNESMYRAFDIPDGTATRSAKIEIYSNKQAIIDGCYGVIDYSDSAVNLNCGNGTVLIMGSGLEISSYFDKGLVLVGKIMSIEFGM